MSCQTYQSKSFNIPVLLFKGHWYISQTSILLHEWASTTSVLSGSRVVLNDCFTLSFLRTLDGLRDWSIQTGRAVVISAMAPGSPRHRGRDIDRLSLSMQSSSLKETLERQRRQLWEERAAHIKQHRERWGGLRAWWRILTYKRWTSDSTGQDSSVKILIS